jgi:hypothetical protein
MATWITASETSRRRSSSRTRRRQRIIQPKVRSTTQRRGTISNEVEEGGLVHQLRPVTARVGEEVLQPGPAATNGGQDRLRASAVRDVGRRQVHYQQSPVRIHGDVALAPDDRLPPS